MNFLSPVKSILVLLFGIQLVSFLPDVSADIRRHRGDAEVVNESDLIVVGHLKKGTLKRVDSERSHHHRATLVVRELLKGELKEKAIEITIYSLRVSTRDNSTSIGGGSDSWGYVVVDDVQNDHIYFLRKTAGGDGKTDEPSFFIRGNEDASKTEHTDYFKILLSDQPEVGLRKLLKTQPELANRAVEFLEYGELQQILAEPDPATRARKIMPFYLGATHDSNRRIAGCSLRSGPESGPYLMASLENCYDSRKRHEIISILASTRYRGAKNYIDRLINNNHLDLEHGRYSPEGSGDHKTFKNLTSEIQACRNYQGEIYELEEAELIKAKVPPTADVFDEN